MVVPVEDGHEPAAPERAAFFAAMAAAARTRARSTRRAAGDRARPKNTGRAESEAVWLAARPKPDGKCLKIFPLCALCAP